MIPAILFPSSVSFDRAWLLGALADRLAGVRLPDAGLYSASVSLPRLSLNTAPLHLPDIWSWTRPSQDLSLIGYGAALQQAFGDNRALGETVARLEWHHDPAEGCDSQPMAFLGHGFGGADPSGLPNALLRVPRLLLRQRGGDTEMVFSHAGGGNAETVRSDWLDAADDLLRALETPLPPLSENVLTRFSETPDRETFLARVGAVTDAINDGRVQKVVLSRRVTVAGARPFVPARLAQALARQHPSCAILTAAFGARVLVAASPERLVAAEDRQVESYALAGTARCDEADPGLDGRLMLSAKDRHEHSLVVGWIEEALRGVCEDLDVPAEPRRMTLGKLQHLWTPISGTLRPDADLLQAAARLHPTPAVAGLPLAGARQILAELGETRSGWYTGAMGWIGRSGDGEMAVVLRCALINGYMAELSAGGGIVGASQPEAEFAETELKLQTMLDALRIA